MWKRLMACLAACVLAAAPAWAEPFTMDDFLIRKSSGGDLLCSKFGTAYDCYNLTGLTPGEGCTDRSLLGVVRQQGVEDWLAPGLEISSVEDLFNRLDEIRGDPVSGNYFECTSVSQSFWSVGLMCLDTISADGITEYDICARSMTKVWQVADPAVFADGGEQPAEETEAEEPAPGHAEVAGPALHEQEGYTVTFTFGEEGGNKRLTLGKGNANAYRDAACKSDVLAQVFADTPADLGDTAPWSTFAQLLEALDSDDNRNGYTWFAPCEVDGRDVQGLVCVDPAYTLERGITLKACAFGEGFYH